MARPRLPSVLAIAALLPLSLPLQAADFTLEVPLRVANVPTMHTVYVECLVSRSPTGGAAGSDIVGRGSRMVTLAGGRYDGTVTVEINATGINPAASARSYRCSARGLGTASTGATYAAQSGNFRDVYERATGHTLDRLTVNVSGPLP